MSETEPSILLIVTYLALTIRSKLLDLNEDFFKHYHYKTELAAICRQHRLPASGTKAVLNQRLQALVAGQRLDTPTSKVKRLAKPVKELSVTTPLANSGFSFNAEARKFFAAYFHVSKFAFTKPMAVLKRQAEAQPQLALTVADLIDVYQATRNSKARQQFLAENAEEKTYEWNRFVHDFFADPATWQFRPRLKVAAILWQQVKQSTAPKQYVHSLLQAYHEDIAGYVQTSSEIDQ